MPVLVCRLAVEVLPVGCERIFATSIAKRQNKYSILKHAHATAIDEGQDDNAIWQVHTHGAALMPGQVVSLQSGDLISTRNFQAQPHLQHAVDVGSPVVGTMPPTFNLSPLPTFWMSPAVVQLARAFDYHLMVSEAESPQLLTRTEFYIDHLRFTEFPLFRQITLEPPWTNWLPR